MHNAGGELPSNREIRSSPSENSATAKFAEIVIGEIRGIRLPRTRLQRGQEGVVLGLTC
jgi:hypothetical protein